MAAGDVLRFLDATGVITNVTPTTPLPSSLSGGGGGVTPGSPLPVRAYDAAGNPVSYGFIPTQLAAAGTVTYKTGAGMVGKIKCNKAGTADTLTVYDALSATGTPIAVITGAIAGNTFCEGDLFGVGFTVVATGTVGNYTISLA
jgi:hypothetical protein